MSSAITGHTGALHAAAQLSHRGWIVSLTLAGAPRTDLFAQHPETPDRVLAIQVKAEHGGGFFLGRELTDPPAERSGEEWFVLVSLRDPESRPKFSVLSRIHVAAAVGTAVACFRGKYNQLGSKNFVGYGDAWASMHEPVTEAAWRLPRWHWRHRDDWPDADEVGMLPEPPFDAPEV